jgi:hypothetical protein
MAVTRSLLNYSATQHMLSLQVHGRVSDIWRSYVAQRILWDSSFQIAFAPPMVTQLRNPHNYLADMQSEVRSCDDQGNMLRRHFVGMT